ncbi:MAG: hypothetical protein K2O41_06730 [Clostridia bacterium]|nr:hypothetical protein [Clostridia bacterium]
MSSTKEQVLTFLEKCEELKKCKFIMATTKIKDLLKCIVNSPDLYRLFDTVTKDFDYLQEKQRCLVTLNDGVFNKSYVILPHTIGQRLAFIFCLLVEFDRDTLNFNDFLQKYFLEDGSYFSSYQAFCKTIINSLEDMLRQVYKDTLEENGEDYEIRAVVPNSLRSKLISEISLCILNERQYIKRCSVQREEKEGAYKILDELLNAVRAGDEQLIDALICGYNYFVLHNKCVSDGVGALIGVLAEYEEIL